MKIRLLGLALVPLLAAPPVFAQDAVGAANNDGMPHGVATNSTTGGDADAAFKRWSVVGGLTFMKPSSRPLDGTSLDVDSDSAPTISASYFFTPNIAVELWGAADKLRHDISTSETGKIGSVRQQPVALSAQYHFGTPDQVFRPFVGVGYYYSNFTNEQLTGTAGNVDVGNAKGAIGTAGVDMNINTTWFARFDARYMHSSPSVSVDGVGTGRSLDLDPWTVGVGVGARF
jgi:outer membrane protein